MVADGSVIIEILGDAKQFTKTLSGIAGGAIKGLTTAIAGTSAALGGITTEAAKVGAGFEESMSQVAATMGLSVEEIQNGSAEFEALSKAAEDAGATTAFSASEAASGLNYLALAGYDAATAAEVLPSVLNLAAAGGMDLAYASDLATDAMAALGIEASNENLTKFGDLMAKTASSANTSVSQLGEAILTVGGTAKNLAGGTTELATALGILANNGIKGAEGGTALRNIILAMTPTTSAACGAFKELNLETYDSAGNLRSLNDIFVDMSNAMSDMTDEEKTDILTKIFNKVDLKSAEALLANVTGGIGDSESALYSVYDAIDQAGVNWGKYEDITIGTLDGISDQIAYHMLELGTSAEELQGYLNFEYGIEAEDALKIIDSVNASVSKNASAWVELSGKIDNSTGAMQNMADVQLDNLSGDITILKSGLEGLGIALYNTMQVNARSAVQAITEAVSDISKALKEGGVEEAVSVAGEKVSEFAAEIAQKAPDFIDAAVSLIKAFVQGIHENLDSFGESAQEIGLSIANGIVEIAPMLLQIGAEILGKIALGIIDAMPELTNALSEMTLNVFGAQTEIAGSIEALSVVFKILLSSIVGVTAATKAYQAAMMISGVIDKVKKAMTLLEGATTAQAAAQAVLNAVMNANPFVAIFTIVTGLLAALVTLVMTSENFREAVVGAFQAVIDVAKKLLDLMGSLIGKLMNFLGLSSNVDSSVREISSGNGYQSSPVLRSAPAAYSAESPAVANAVTALKSAPAALSAPALASVNSGIAARLRSAVEAEAGRMSGMMTVSSNVRSLPRMSNSYDDGAASRQSSTPAIIRPHVTVEFTGDAAQLGKYLNPIIKAEDTRIGTGL